MGGPSPIAAEQNWLRLLGSRWRAVTPAWGQDAVGLLLWQQSLPTGSPSAPEILQFAAPHIKLIWQWLRKGNLRGVLQKARYGARTKEHSWGHLVLASEGQTPCLSHLPSQWVIHPVSLVFWEGMSQALRLPNLLKGAWMPDFETSGITQARAELRLP